MTFLQRYYHLLICLTAVFTLIIVHSLNYEKNLYRYKRQTCVEFLRANTGLHNREVRNYCATYFPSRRMQRCLINKTQSGGLTIDSASAVCQREIKTDA